MGGAFLATANYSKWQTMVASSAWVMVKLTREYEFCEDSVLRVGVFGKDGSMLVGRLSIG